MYYEVVWGGFEVFWGVLVVVWGVSTVPKKAFSKIICLKCYPFNPMPIIAPKCNFSNTLLHLNKALKL